MLKIKLLHTQSILFFVCLSMLIVSGCTHVYEQPIYDIDLSSATKKIDLPVQLVLTENYRNTNWEKKSMGDTFILPIGENLVHHTILLVRNVFVQPFIPDDSINTQGQNFEPKFFLQPKVAFIEQSFGVSAFSEAKTSIGIEWSLSRKTGDVVWVETIIGVGIGKAGNAFTAEDHQKKRAQMALQDLFAKSQKEMLSSPLLRRLY